MGRHLTFGVSMEKERVLLRHNEQINRVAYNILIIGYGVRLLPCQPKGAQPSIIIA
jgi:hypothetical protein